MFALLFAALAVVPTAEDESIRLEPAITEIRYSISRFAKLGDVSKRIAKAIAKSAIENDLTPEFLLAVAIWESDLNPKVKALHPQRDGTTAIDTGLMGIRCVVPDLQPGRRCLNEPVRGVEFRRLLEVDLNIQIGARMLAGLREGPVRIWTRGRQKTCPHAGHAFYAHYNWGQQILAESEYDESVASLTRALTQLTGCEPAPEIEGTAKRPPAPPLRVRALVKVLRAIKLSTTADLASANGVCGSVDR